MGGIDARLGIEGGGDAIVSGAGGGSVGHIDPKLGGEDHFGGGDFIVSATGGRPVRLAGAGTVVSGRGAGARSGFIK